MMTYSTRLDLARAAAREYAKPCSQGARCIQIANTIDELVGRQVWDGRRYRLSWPKDVADLAGRPDKHCPAGEE